jgi:YVTN family beta-propeller protein
VGERGPGGRGQRGSSLIEVAVALFIIAVLFPALAAFFITVLRSNAVAEDVLAANGNAAPRRGDVRGFVRTGIDYANPQLQPGQTPPNPPDRYRECSATLKVDSESIIDAAFPSSQGVSVDILSIQSRDILASPAGIADSGSSVWVADGNSDKVWRIDPSDNSISERVTVGKSPAGVLAAAGSIWVANAGSDTVSRIDPADNSVSAPIPVGDSPNQLAWDGQRVWVTNSGSNSVSRIDPNGNSVAGPFTVGAGPSGIVFGANALWVANTDSNNVSKVNPTDGSVQTTVTGLVEPVGLAFAEGSLWVANSGQQDIVNANSIVRVNPANAQEVAAIGLPPGGKGPQGLAALGSTIWVTTYGNDQVARIDAATNSISSSAQVGIDPVWVATNSGRAWVSNTSAGSVSRLSADGTVTATIDVASGPCGQSGDDTGAQTWRVCVTPGTTTSTTSCAGQVTEFIKVDR